jgi:signal transduction histidine kinase
MLAARDNQSEFMNVKIPSIRLRLANALLVWAIVWGAAVTLALWLAVHQEVDELLDDTLVASAALIGSILPTNNLGVTQSEWSQRQQKIEATAPEGDQFAWQVVGPEGQVLLRSPLAPKEALHSAPLGGFTRVPGWRIFGQALGGPNTAPIDAAQTTLPGRMLYVAQAQEERDEVQTEIALTTALVALAVGFLGHLWLRRKVQHELAPLQSLSDRLTGYDPLDHHSTLGLAQRLELEPVHTAIDALAHRLKQRVAHERAFTAHAAHSLRTPLAGMDAQLAMALRECPPELQARLQRVREGAARLQRVVAALLTLFRTGVDIKPQNVDLNALLARLPLEGLQVLVQATEPLQADPDLLAAALLNLLDNSLRYGASQALITTPAPNTVLVHDDGPGCSPQRRAEMETTLAQQSYQGQTGLGLMLADLVARAHGGRLQLMPSDTGFAVVLVLG